jgi:NADPH2:quinone reductase
VAVAQAIILREHGGPEVLQPTQVVVRPPGYGEILVRQTAIGVNFHDIYVRNGLYKSLLLPGTPGIEGVGVIEAVGGGAAGLRVGDRIAYVSPGYGAYASRRLLPANLALRIPTEASDQAVASSLVRGLTVQMLTRDVHKLRRGDTILVHAAASGVGRQLTEWASHLGATVIGTVGSPERVDIARKAGCQEVILYRDESFKTRVREITFGRGVDVAYDSVGKDTFSGSLDCLAVRGHLVNFGQSSGAVEPFEVSRLAARSNTVSRPILFHYIGRRAQLEALAKSFFDALVSGIITSPAPVIFSLADAASAHRTLAARTVHGPVIMVPD